MSDIFFLFLIVSFILAAFARDRVIFAILYLFASALLLGWFWSRRSLRSLIATRKFTPYAFLQDKIRVNLTVQNTGWLPITWSRLLDALPTELSESGSFRRILSFGPKEIHVLTYELFAKKRGYYRIGPLSLTSGDVLGLAGEVRIEREPDFLTIFPKVVPLKFIRLPSSSPIGVIRHIQPIFEDPSRSAGKREYYPGDSMRRIDWKASAAVGNIQVKVFDPSIDLLVFLFLNLNVREYETRYLTSATELAITTTASIARWVIDQRLATGIFINGIDAANSQRNFDLIQPHKGRVQLLRILELLARSQFGDLPSIQDYIVSHGGSLGWGTTIILITGMADDKLFDKLYQLRRSGINIVLILCGEVGNAREIEVRARYFDIPVHLFNSERDLDIWRK
jgi:uncharacterized protein (DUF58 family)